MAQTSTIRKEEAQKRLRSNEEKWTQPLMAVGWTALPSILLEKQPALGLDALDLNILLQLARYWWTKDNLPHPSKNTIAKLLGVDPSTVRRRVTRMVKEDLIEREARFDKSGGQQSNFYSFEGLIRQLTPHAIEAAEMKDRQHSENIDRQNRKKSKLANLKIAVMPKRGRK